MHKVLISDNVSKECVEILGASKDIEVTFNTKLTPEELRSSIGQYDALIVRSATKVRAEILESACRLKVIGRAGAGVDNIDVKKATEKGIVVMNTPGGNTVSTAEHAFSLMLSLARNIPQADRSVKEGVWNPKKYMGVELRGKTLAVIGLGNIGREVSSRALAFSMRVLGYDPFISPEMAEHLGIELADLDRIWAEADFITVHTPLNDGTRHLVNADTLSKMKPGVRLINCARGGIFDEKAVLEALESGKVAGAALDVYEKEPPENNPLAAHERVISTPHLGASTTEAQDIVAVMIAEQVRDYLLKGEVRNAVNIPPMAPEVFEQVKPFSRLGKNMGALLGQMGKGQLRSITITYYGEMRNFDTWVVTSSILEGLFTRGYSEGVNLVNAKSTAEKLGIKVNEIKSSDEMDYRSSIDITLKTSSGPLSILGAIFGKDHSRIVRFQDYDVEFIPEGYFLICGNRDRPGIIGDIGTVLGRKGINIAHMTWARRSPGGEAIVVLNTDDGIDEGTLDAVKAVDGIEWASFIELND
jgi:D-3-phosphoglycerate dehydrogenase / 2-oxoglutarate reductase